MGMALRPVRILRGVPAMVELGGRGGRIGFGTGKIGLEQASVGVLRDVRTGAKGVGIEEGVGTVAEALADQRVMDGRERRREGAEQAPPRIKPRPELSPAYLRKPNL